MTPKLPGGQLGLQPCSVRFAALVLRVFYQNPLELPTSKLRTSHFKHLNFYLSNIEELAHRDQSPQRQKMTKAGEGHPRWKGPLAVTSDIWPFGWDPSPGGRLRLYSPHSGEAQRWENPSRRTAQQRGHARGAPAKQRQAQSLVQMMLTVSGM